MKYVLLLAVLLSPAARADECKMPVCTIAPNPDSPWEHVLQINGITFQHESVLGLQSLVDSMARYERKGVCKAVYPEEN